MILIPNVKPIPSTMSPGIVEKQTATSTCILYIFGARLQQRDYPIFVPKVLNLAIYSAQPAEHIEVLQVLAITMVAFEDLFDF